MSSNDNNNNNNNTTNDNNSNDNNGCKNIEKYRNDTESHMNNDIKMQRTLFQKSILQDSNINDYHDNNSFHLNNETKQKNDGKSQKRENIENKNTRNINETQNEFDSVDNHKIINYDKKKNGEIQIGRAHV